MARPKVRTPKLSFHVSGQSIVQIAGRMYYLGEHNSPIALARYAHLVKLYREGNLSLPADYEPPEIPPGFAEPSPLPPVQAEPEAVTVAVLMAGFEAHASQIYAEAYAELSRIKALCRDVTQNAGTVLASEYGPRLLKGQREHWVTKGNSRQYVNRLVRILVSAFRWGVSEELIEETTWNRLKSVTPLRCGQTKAPEPVKRLPANIAHVRAAAVRLTPILRDMVKVAVSTAMRPSEVCSMRPMDIDRSGPEWVYRPPKHKNLSKGIDRAIPLIDGVREVVENYINRKADAYIFSPVESEAWRRAKQRAERRTRVQPSQVSRAKANPQRTPGERYTHDSFRRAVYTACDVAGVPRWSPYRLRHLALTEIRSALDCEASQALAGHTTPDMTQRYASLKLEKSIEAARAAPKL